MQERTGYSRRTVAIIAALLSASALALGAVNAEAASWHYGSSSLLTAPAANGGTAYTPCPYSLPAGAIGGVGRLGLHQVTPSGSHGWAELTSSWDNAYFINGQSLGYSPGASVTIVCSNSSGTSGWNWIQSPYYDLWTSYHPGGGAASPNFTCPGATPYLLAGGCTSRAWW